MNSDLFIHVIGGLLVAGSVRLVDAILTACGCCRRHSNEFGEYRDMD